MSGRLQKYVAVVTGGASGLGLAVVRRFVEEGASVVVLDRRQLDLSVELPDPSRVANVVGDVRSFSANAAAVCEAQAKFGRLDVFVANAGIWDGNRAAGELEAAAVDRAFDEVFAVNVKAYLLGAMASMAALEATDGSLIFTLSVASFHTGGGGPIYTASKHAALGLLRQLAFELAPRIRVNGVAPSGIATNLRGPASLGLDDDVVSIDTDLERRASIYPLPIPARPEDFASYYVLLASRSESATATGTVIAGDVGLGIRGIGRVTGRS
jgi:2,3-dihydroxy-2,3-dihydrophenylpropionate dehydrogenase